MSRLQEPTTSAAPPPLDRSDAAFRFLSRRPRAAAAPPMVCEPVLDDPGTLTLTVVAADRVGLLSWLLDEVQKLDPTLAIDAGSGRVVEKYAVLFLVLRIRGTRGRLRGLVEPLRALGKTAAGGAPVAPARFARVAVRVPDAPGALAAVCRVLAEQGVSIESLEIDPSEEYPEGTDLLHGSGPLVGTAVCDFTLDLEIPAEALPAVSQLPNRIAQAGEGFSARYVDAPPGPA